MSDHSLNRSSKPFLRWAGGKNWLIKYLPGLIKDLDFNNYHEPFFGGGSVFFALSPDGAILSDINEELINTYVEVRDNVESVIKIIDEWAVNEDQYYAIRSEEPDDSIRRAARFIYLNRTSFNGIYRVNRKGQYKVPYGKKDSYKFNFQRIRHASEALQGATLLARSFEESLKDVKAGDLVFLDPPYTVAHNNNGFIEYNKKLFSLDDQFELKSCIDAISELGAFYILTNAHHEVIDDLFSPGSIKLDVSRSSTLGGRNARRGNTQEYIFTNIPQARIGDIDGLA